MNQKDILKKTEFLLEALQNSQFEELNVELAGEKICLKKETSSPLEFSHFQGGISRDETLVSENKNSSEAERGLHLLRKVKSELVGTFFFPKKNIPKEGSWVDKGQVIGVVHCLGIDNYLRSPYTGIVKKMYVGEGDIVDYGKVLLEIEE